MAQKVLRIVTDDLDGSEDASTVTFSLDGVNYEIDLNDANADKLRKHLNPFIEKARRLGGRRNMRPTSNIYSVTRREDVKAMRTWARKNGYDLSDRGRISHEVQEAYKAAQPS